MATIAAENIKLPPRAELNELNQTSHHINDWKPKIRQGR